MSRCHLTRLASSYYNKASVCVFRGAWPSCWLAGGCLRLRWQTRRDAQRPPDLSARVGYNNISHRVRRGAQSDLISGWARTLYTTHGAI